MNNEELRKKLEYLLIAMQDGNMARRMVIDESISLFRQAADEVIGEDEPDEGFDSWVENMRVGKNILRSEQRERLNKLIGKK